MTVPAGLIAQTSNTFNITGQLKNVDASWIYLTYTKSGKRVMDSTKVNNGAYAFSGDLADNTGASLLDARPAGMMVRSGTSVQVFLVPGSFQITHVDSFSNTVITGSRVNTEYKEYQAELKPYQDRQRAFFTKYMEARKNNDTAAVKALKKEGDGITQEATEKVIYPFIKSHATSPLALYVLQSDATRDKNTKMLQSLFDMLSDEIKNSAAGKALQAKLLAGDKAGGSVSMLDNMSIGGTAPDFTQNDTGGKPVTLSSFRGKYVLLDFWASWCAPCRRENPNVVKAYTQYHPKGFDILSVSLDKPGDKDKWLKAIQDDGLTWTQVSDLQYFDNAVAKQYGIQGIPQNFLIDPQGKIIAKGLRGDDLEKKLEEIYKD